MKILPINKIQSNGNNNRFIKTKTKNINFSNHFLWCVKNIHEIDETVDRAQMKIIFVFFSFFFLSFWVISWALANWEGKKNYQETDKMSWNGQYLNLVFHWLHRTVLLKAFALNIHQFLLTVDFRFRFQFGQLNKSVPPNGIIEFPLATVRQKNCNAIGKNEWKIIHEFMPVQMRKQLTGQYYSIKWNVGKYWAHFVNENEWAKWTHLQMLSILVYLVFLLFGLHQNKSKMLNQYFMQHGKWRKWAFDSSALVDIRTTMMMSVNCTLWSLSLVISILCKVFRYLFFTSPPFFITSEWNENNCRLVWSIPFTKMQTENENYSVCLFHQTQK